MGAFKDFDIELKELRRLLQETQVKLDGARNEITGLRIKLQKLDNESNALDSTKVADAYTDWN